MSVQTRPQAYGIHLPRFPPGRLSRKAARAMGPKGVASHDGPEARDHHGIERRRACRVVCGLRVSGAVRERVVAEPRRLAWRRRVRRRTIRVADVAGEGRSGVVLLSAGW